MSETYGISKDISMYRDSKNSKAQAYLIEFESENIEYC